MQWPYFRTHNICNVTAFNTVLLQQLNLLQFSLVLYFNDLIFFYHDITHTVLVDTMYQVIDYLFINGDVLLFLCRFFNMFFILFSFGNIFLLKVVLCLVWSIWLHDGVPEVVLLIVGNIDYNVN